MIRLGPTLRLVQFAALIAAVCLSGYLSYLKMTSSIPPCTLGGGCTAALYSSWGYLAGVPLALIGLAASLVLVALSLAARPAARMATAVLFAVGMLFTVYLRYVEQAHFDGAVCVWCVAFMIAWWVAALAFAGSSWLALRH